jgi:glycosyltransferase involved in cell wall biosynthesis
MKIYLLVSGDFTTWGGMDRANYELAWYLAEEPKAKVHLVSYHVAEPLCNHPNAVWHKLKKPLNSYLLAEPLMRREGRRIAKELVQQGARVIVNGGNCSWGDVNWIHAVHAAWDTRHEHAPAHFRLRASLLKHKARRDERDALRQAKLVITNSEAARRQVIERVGISEKIVHAVYYGIDADVFYPPDEEEKKAAQRKLNLSEKNLIAVFIGALGHDRNKGFDVLFEAWEKLCADEAWDVDLIALGQGVEVGLWQERAREKSLSERVRLIGFSQQVKDYLKAADVLISPTHYDAYGLGVHEALCCGLPAFVTRSAGVAERYPKELNDLLLNDPPNADDLVQRLKRWRANIDDYKARVASFGEQLRQRAWTDMAREIVELIDSTTL